MLNDKGIGPVIGSALLLVVSVVSVIGFQSWLTSYNLDIIIKVDSQNELTAQTKIEKVIGEILYFNNQNSGNITIRKIKINNFNCGVPLQNYSQGIQEINISLCVQNLTNEIINVVVYSDNKIFEKEFFYGTNEEISIIIEDSSLNCVNITNGIIAQWHFDLNWNDTSGNNFHATNFSGANFNSTESILNGSAYFDGVNDYLTVNDDIKLRPYTNNWTFLVWAKVSDVAISAPFIVKRQTSSPYESWGMGITLGDSLWNPGKKFFSNRMGNPSSNRKSFYTDDDVVDGNWHFYSSVINYGESIQMYVDGNFVNSTDTYVASNWGQVDNPEIIYIGGNQPISEYIETYLDEMIIYNRSLNQSELDLIYGGNLLGKPVCDP